MPQNILSSQGKKTILSGLFLSSSTLPVYPAMPCRLQLFVFLALLNASSLAEEPQEPSPYYCCRSNSTHLAWKQPPCAARRSKDISSTVAIQKRARRLLSDLSSTDRQSKDNANAVPDGDTLADEDAGSSCYCVFESMEQAQEAAYQYLHQNIMAFDLPFRSTLGFVDNSDNNSDMPDGLDEGLVGPTIEYALQTKLTFEWADVVPQHIFYEYVLNFANLNEGRTNWRPLLYNQLRGLFNVTTTTNVTDLLSSTTSVSNMTVSDAVLLLNTHMWKLLAPRHVDSITFVSGSTPLIFDPMSILAFGYASCTGLAILMVNALRAFGIPARVAGTSAWNQRRSQGNHNWVEVWDKNQWYFFEPSPMAIRPEDVDSIDKDPCARWFCHKDRFQYENPGNSTRVSAAKLESSTHDTFFRMAWEWDNPSVPGDDVTAYYQQICSKC
jgi:hypothetical protein